MSRLWKIVLLVAVGVAAAIVIGLFGARGSGSGSGESQAEAQSSFCTSLTNLGSSTKALTSLDPKTASRSEYEAGVDAIQSDWDQVKTDAQDLHGVNMSALDSSWDGFTSAVESVPGSDSVSASLQAVTKQAQALVTTVQTTVTGFGCST